MTRELPYPWALLLLLFGVFGLVALPTTAPGLAQQHQKVKPIRGCNWPPAPEDIVNLDQVDQEGRFTGLTLVADGQLSLYTVPDGKRLVLMDFSLRGSPNGNDGTVLGLREDDAGTLSRKLGRGLVTSGWDGPTGATGAAGFNSALGVVFESGTDVVLVVDNDFVGTITDVRVEAFNGYLVDD